MTTMIESAGWRAAGACLHADPDLFFPISDTGRALAQIVRAKEICAGCLARRECLEFAQANEPIQGIWGGTTSQERAAARRVNSEPSRAGSARTSLPR